MIVRRWFAAVSLTLACTCLASAQTKTETLPDNGTRTTVTSTKTAGSNSETSTSVLEKHPSGDTTILSHTATRDQSGKLLSESTKTTQTITDKDTSRPEPPATEDVVQTRTYNSAGESTVVTVTTTKVGTTTAVTNDKFQVDKTGKVVSGERSLTISQPGQTDRVTHTPVSNIRFTPVYVPPAAPQAQTVAAPAVAPAPQPPSLPLPGQVQNRTQRQTIQDYVDEIKARYKAFSLSYGPGNTTLQTACRNDRVQYYGIRAACGSDFFLEWSHAAPYYTEHIDRLLTVESALAWRRLTPLEMSYYANGMQSWRAGHATIAAAFLTDVRAVVKRGHIQDQYNEAQIAFKEAQTEDPASNSTRAAQSRIYAVIDQLNAVNRTNDYVAAGRYLIFSGVAPNSSDKPVRPQSIAPPMTSMPQLKPL